MLKIDNDHLIWLRDMARQGATPSRLLRELMDRVDPEEPTGVILAWYLMQAFDLDQHQVNAVFGWRPDGTGSLTDAKLDQALSRHLKADTFPPPTTAP